MDDDEDLEDDGLFGAGGSLGVGGPSHYPMRGGSGAGGGVSSMMSAEAVWSQKVVHAQIALEPDDDCDEDSFQ